jgi:molecular chaperone DnaK
MASDNKSIGRFILDGVLPAPRGVPQIEVSFDIDANGILSVSAADKGTGKEQKIVIQPSSGLAKEEIERMVDDAKTHEDDDQRRRAEVETRNQADSLVYTTEKMIADNADKVPEDLKEEVEGKLATLKSAIEANSVPEMQTSMADLNSALQRLGQAVYSQAAASDMPTDGPMGDMEDTGDIPGDISDDGVDSEDVATADSDSSEAEAGDSTVEGEFREV